MATNQNNIHINSFSKGMNTDTSLDMVGNEQYVFGQNIRITANALLNGDIDSNSKEGIITPVPSGQNNHGQLGDVGNSSILAVSTLGDVGAVILKDQESKWHVYRVDRINDQLNFNRIFSSKKKTNKNKFSTIINKELDGVTKLYIADGQHSVMSINLDKGQEYYDKLNVEDLETDSYFPVNPVIISEKISGTLRTGQIQYTYRYYNKYGVCSKLAPLTNKIQVIDSSRNKEIGNAENTQTSIGFQLQIDYPDDIKDKFKRLQLFRLHYIKPNADAVVDLIYDAEISNNVKVIKINDDGLKSIQNLSLQEFASINGMNIVPQCIEQNQNYLFAANITDNTVLKPENENFDARAFQFNSQGRILLYNNNNTTYSLYGDKAFRQYDNVKSAYELPDYTLNKYVDMTTDIGADLPCKYYLSSKEITISQLENSTCGQAVCGLAQCGTEYTSDNTYIQSVKYLGGQGKNVSWRFVTTYIPLDQTNESSKNNPPLPDVVDYGSLNGNIWYLVDNNGVIETEFTSQTINQVFAEHNVITQCSFNYNDIFTSSLFRSLKRDEVYRYGIIVYDDKGRHSDVQWIADIRTPTESEFPSTCRIDSNVQKLYARPIGIQFDVKLDENSNIVAYQIVRCAKTAAYSKNLMQCVVSRPTRQPLVSFENASSSVQTKKMSPYYPMPFLTSEQLQTTFYTFEKNKALHYSTPIVSDFKIASESDSKNKVNMFVSNNKLNNELFQLFSPEIQVLQDDSLSKLQSFVSRITPVSYVFGKSLQEISEELSWTNNDPCINGGVDNLQFLRNATKGADQWQFGNNLPGKGSTNTTTCMFGTPYDKTSLSFVMKMYNSEPTSENSCEISNIKNTSNPNWEEGFSNINGAGGVIISGVKQYKSFSTSIGQYEYVNWVCNGMYDLRISANFSLQGYRDNAELCAMIEHGRAQSNNTATYREPEAAGWIGPGPRCFLAQIKNSNSKYMKTNNVEQTRLGTYIVNITHTPLQYAGLTKEQKQYDIYYGFGNTKKIENKNSTKFNVFDGDVYITPCEITSMYKTYDFNSYDTLPSAQLVYYVPLESPINTYFDYGMCYKNTQSKTVLLEPGEIGGVVVQDRPEHQYNTIYSDNNVSNDVYNVQSLDDNTEVFPHRIHYSQLKTNGELIDNWQIFKPLDYIDADTRYGDITNLLTNKDVIYFWQNQAFGKLSVNERSLVTDNNNNTVQLGQGGVLQRTDYINTRYGMRPEDYSAISAEGAIYWIDILNKAILMSNGQSVISLGEQTNVQSLVNKYISQDIPTIHYDLQNNELLCKCLNNGQQIVFNIKLNVATSVYTRKYEDIIVFNNVLYGMLLEDNEYNVRKYNYIDSNIQYSEPIALSFVVNPSASITKVFDDQEIVTMSRGNDPSNYMNGKQFSFATNTIDKIQKNPDGHTDREGNIRYAIPRHAEQNYGNRIRGKWMKVDIEDNEPKYEHSISHILTKFRQSFS